MLHLMIQPPGKPVNDPVFGAKINGGQQLVYGPGIFHTPILLW